MDEPPGTNLVVTVRTAGHGRQRLITLSDGRDFLFSEEACAQVGVHDGDAADPALLEALDAAEQRAVAHEAALRLLAHRPRSETEMRTRLAMRGVESSAIEDEVSRLREAGLLDDQEFARAWVEDRKRLAPRGRRMLRYELLGRGIKLDAVDLVTEDVDDRETALALARSKARGSALASYETFLTRVGGFLKRRGFDYAVTAEAVRVVWTEVTAASQASQFEPFGEP